MIADLIKLCINYSIKSIHRSRYLLRLFLLSVKTKDYAKVLNNIDYRGDI